MPPYVGSYRPSSTSLPPLWLARTLAPPGFMSGEQARKEQGPSPVLPQLGPVLPGSLARRGGNSLRSGREVVRLCLLAPFREHDHGAVVPGHALVFAEDMRQFVGRGLGGPREAAAAED